MADIQVSREHGTSLENARLVLERVAEELAKEHGIHWSWQDDFALKFGRTGIDGVCHVTEQVLEINITLSLIMKPVKSILQGAVVRRLDGEIDKLSS